MKLGQIYRPLWEYSYKFQCTGFVNEKVALSHLSVDSCICHVFDLAVNEQ